jgi:hypothetical protein
VTSLSFPFFMEPFPIIIVAAAGGTAIGLGILFVIETSRIFTLSFHNISFLAHFYEAYSPLIATVPTVNNDVIITVKPAARMYMSIITL